MLFGTVDQRQRLGHRLFAGGFIPLVFDEVTVPGEPPGGTEHRRDADPHAGIGQQIEPAGMGHRQVGQGCYARQQQLRQRDTDAVRHRLGVSSEDRQVLVERGIIEAGTADFVDQPLVHRLAGRVRVDVHKAGHHHHAGAVDDDVRRSGIASADEGDRPAVEGHVRVR
jgi:hypothetical protein